VQSEEPRRRRNLLDRGAPSPKEKGPRHPLQAHRDEQLHRRRHRTGLCPAACADGGGRGDGGGDAEELGSVALLVPTGTLGERRGEGEDGGGKGLAAAAARGRTLVGGEERLRPISENEDYKVLQLSLSNFSLIKSLGWTLTSATHMEEPRW
jgi:hypothetical protein